MKRIACALLALLLLCSGCTAQGNGVLQNRIVMPGPANTASPAQTPSADEAIPEAERKYYVSYNLDYRGLSGGVYSEQDLKMLAIILRLDEWQSLTMVLSAFETRMGDDPAGDLRLCDLTSEEGALYDYSISSPIYKEEFDIAYLSIRSAHWQREEEYVLLFVKRQGEETYAAQGIVTLHNDYYGDEPTFSFRKLGDKTYLVWNGLSGHGIGFNDYSEEWHDLENGLVFSFDTHGYDTQAKSEGMETTVWETKVSYEPVSLNTKGDYYINAQDSYSFSLEDGWEETYRYDYRIYYDAEKDAFYTAYDALLPMYRQAQSSKHETVLSWAKGRIKYMEELHNPVKAEMPAKDQRFLLGDTASHIQEVELTGDKLTEKKLRSLAEGINSRADSTLGDVLSAHGLGGLKEGASHDLLYGIQLNSKNAVYCRLDMETCMERIALFHISYMEGHTRRGITLAYTLTREGNQWDFNKAIQYPLYGDEFIKPVVTYYNPRGFAVSVPVAQKNEHPLYETIVLGIYANEGLMFAGGFFGRDGVCYEVSFHPSGWGEERRGDLWIKEYRMHDTYEKQGYVASMDVWSDYSWQGGEAFISKEDAQDMERLLG